MDIMDKMTGIMMGRMSKEEKGEMMFKMMEGGKGTGMPMVPQMMTEMMPQCLRMMLPNVAKEKRIDFVLKMVDNLMEQGCVGMSEEEKKDFLAEVVKKVKA